MPTAANPYQRVIIDGIPYWKDVEGSLYYYESSTPPTKESRICLGTVAAGLYSDWQDRLAERLETYRAQARSYTRKPAAAVSATAPSSTTQ